MTTMENACHSWSWLTRCSPYQIYIPEKESECSTTNIEIQINKSSSNGRRRIWYSGKKVDDFSQTIKWKSSVLRLYSKGLLQIAVSSEERMDFSSRTLCVKVISTALKLRGQEESMCETTVYFAKYFTLLHGAIPWQYDKVRS